LVGGGSGVVGIGVGGTGVVGIGVGSSVGVGVSGLGSGGEQAKSNSMRLTASASNNVVYCVWFIGFLQTYLAMFLE
jgi:hypothetical protein